MPWAKNDWLASEECKEALFVASHHGVGKEENQNSFLSSEVEEFHKNRHWPTVNFAAW